MPVPPTAAQIRKTPAEAVTAIDELLDHHTHTEIAGILNTRGLTSGEGRPFHRLIVRNIRDEYGLRSREQRLRDAGMLTLAEIADRLGVYTGTVKTWYHAGLITGHPFNDKGECLYPPPSENPPARAQGRKLSERAALLTAPADEMNPPELSDPTATVPTRTTTQHPSSTRRGAVCNPRFRPRAPGRDLHRLDTGAGQDRVEGCGELPGPVADQEPEVRGAVTEVHQQIADLLRGPRPVRVRGDPEDVHIAGADLHHEQAIQAPEGHRAVHVEEVGGQHRRGLGAQKLPPGRIGAPLSAPGGSAAP